MIADAEKAIKSKHFFAHVTAEMPYKKMPDP